MERRPAPRARTARPRSSACPRSWTTTSSSARSPHRAALLHARDDPGIRVDWAEEADPEVGLRIALALEQFWVTTNPREGSSRFETFLARAPAIPLALKARALRDLGGSTEVSGDWEHAAEHYAQSLQLFEQVGDERGILRLRHRLGQISIYGGNLEDARTLIQETLERARTGGFGYEESDLLHALSVLEFNAGNVEVALDLQRESLELCRRFGRWAWGECIKLANLARFANALGRSKDAATYGREALAISYEIGSRSSIVFALATLAVAARARGDDERAGRLWRAIEAEEERSFLGRWPTRRAEVVDSVLVPHSAELERGLESGRGMTLEDAVTYALEETSD